MGKIQIHGLLASMPTRFVAIVCELNEIPYEIVPLDSYQKTPEFKKLNPQMLTPVLVDDGFTLPESRAIAQYLIDKYAKNDFWYPKDLKTRAVVNARLNFDCGTLWPRVFKAVGPAFAGYPSAPEDVQSVKAALEIVEEFLTRDKWLAGSKVTLADISFAAIITLLSEFKLDLSPYPKVRSWVEEVNKIEAFKKLNEQGLAILKEKFPNIGNPPLS